MDEELRSKLEAYFENHKLKHYKKGEIIMRPGDQPNFIGFIKNGYVRMYTLSESGQEITIQFFKPVLYFTIIFANSGMANRYYFEAITPVEIYQAPINEAMEFFRSHSEINRALMNIVMVSMLDLIDQMGSLLSGNAYNKVASMIVSLTNNKQPKKAVSGRMDFGITHRLIASLTGLTRETVTLQMIRLEKEGLIINKNKKVVVTNCEGLLKAARAELK